MTTSFFTFGFDHRHVVDGVVFDREVVLKVTAPDPRAVVVGLFGLAWAFEYPTLSEVTMDYYPRGVLSLSFLPYQPLELVAA